jgi:dephospho-CoA kinase
MKNRLPLTVGVTGGIGAGKTIVCDVFKTLGIPVYHSDARAGELMEHDPELIKEIRLNFGEKSYIGDDQLDRKYLSDLVFSDKAKLQLLNSIVHPRVFNDFHEWIILHKNQQYLIKEAALLFESESYKDLDITILVYCPLELRIKRTLLRDTTRTTESIQQIVDNQLSDSKKKKMADMVIINDDSRLILPQILKIHEDLLRRVPEISC